MNEEHGPPTYGSNVLCFDIIRKDESIADALLSSKYYGPFYEKQRHSNECYQNKLQYIKIFKGVCLYVYSRISQKR